MTGTDAVLAVEGLVVRYGSGPTAVTALDGVDLSVRAGELVALAGPSGSGKSSLCHVVSGFERPTAGVVRIDGTELTSPPAWATLAVVPQRLGLVPELTVEETVALPVVLAARGPARGPVPGRDSVGASGSRPSVPELLAELGLAGLEHRRVGETSLGERQRTALARAFVLEPRLLVLDEPTGHQDDEHVEVVRTAITAAAARGSAVLVSTHDDRVLEVAHRVVRLDEGRVVRGRHVLG